MGSWETDRTETGKSGRVGWMQWIRLLCARERRGYVRWAFPLPGEERQLGLARDSGFS